MKKLLIEFANFLNEYKGQEDVRFDFMVIDFLQKRKADYLPGTDADDPIIRLQKKYANENPDDYHIENIPKYADWLENEMLNITD